MFFRADVKWFPADWRMFRWQSQTEMMEMYWESMKDKYEAQIRRVKEVVPEDRLLVWNIKEGWEPLCKFLNRPVPNVPIPVSAFLIVKALHLLSTIIELETMNLWRNTFLKAMLEKK